MNQRNTAASVRASASWIDVGATSHGLTGEVSPFGKVTSLRPLRRLIWIGTDRVSLPSLVCTGERGLTPFSMGYRVGTQREVGENRVVVL